MNKQLMFWRLIILLFLTILVVLVSQVVIFLFGEDYSGSPAYFSAYSNSGYYEINPETILTNIDQGNNDVFVPFFGDPNRDEPYYDNIVWTQSDYLKIANALSLETWNEPLDLETWQVIDMDLIGSCDDNAQGFHTFTITYYKSLGLTNWERHYATRLIEINSWQGLVRWGKDAVFSTPLVLGWDGTDLNQFKITADDALQIAETNGGSDVRLKVDNACRFVLRVNQLSPLPHRVNWLVDYDRADFYMHINPYTGKYNILNSGQ